MAHPHRNYTADALVRDLHAVPRYDRKGHRVPLRDPPFQPERLDYDEALVCIASAFAILGALIMLGSCIRLCCISFKKRRKQSTFSIPKYRKILVAFIVLSAIGFAGSIVGTNVLREAVGMMKNKLDAAAEGYQSIQSSGNFMIGTLNITRVLISALDPTEQGAQATALLSAGAANTLGNVTNFVSSQMSADFSTSTLDSYVSSWTDYFAYGSIGFTIFLLIPVLATTGGLLARKALLLSFAGWAMSLFLLFGFAIAGTEFAVSVGVSDFCIDPNTATAYYMKRYAQNESETIDYYVHCRDGAAPPFVEYFQGAQKGLINSLLAVENLTACATDCLKNNETEVLATIYTNLNNTAAVLGLTSTESECAKIHDKYTSMVHDACGPGLVGIVILWSSHLAISLLFALMVWPTSALWPVYETAAGYSTIQTPTDSHAAWYDVLGRSGRESAQPITAQQWFAQQDQVQEHDRQAQYRDLFASPTSNRDLPPKYSDKVGTWQDV